MCVTDHGLSHVGRHCPNLRQLDLYRYVVFVISSCCVRVWTRNLETWFVSLPYLCHRCMAITDAGIADIAKGCPSLEMINMAYCDKISDTSLESLAHCLLLKTLEIRGCPSISSAGLTAVAMGCSQLAVLDIKKTCITDAGLIGLAQHSLFLRQVNLGFWFLKHGWFVAVHLSRSRVVCR